MGVILLLQLTPERMTDDLSILFRQKRGLRDQSLTARGEKKQGRLLLKFDVSKRRWRKPERKSNFPLPVRLRCC